MARRAAGTQRLSGRPSHATGAKPGRLPEAAAPGWKRGLDILCIGLCAPLILPVMVVIALWIKLFSRGPALLRQTRMGRHGTPFVMYKFRSMKLNASTERQEAYVRGLVRSDSPMIKLDLVCDPRLITGGGLLRAAGLDELPQLLNVLRGEMSLVGPRPCLPGEYGLFSPEQRERFNALPGLSGLWQVNGKNRRTFREMNALDIRYVRNASLRMDLRILLQTPAALVSQMSLAFRQKLTARRRLASAATRGASNPAYPSPSHSQSL